MSAMLLALTVAATACQDTSAIPPTSQAGATFPGALKASKQVPQIDTPPPKSEPNSPAKIEPATPAIDPGNPAEVITMDEAKGGLANATKGLAINPSPVPVSQQTPGDKAAGAKGGATKGQPGPGPTGVVEGPKLQPKHLAESPADPDDEEGSPQLPSEMVKGDAKLKPIVSPNQVQ